MDQGTRFSFLFAVHIPDCLHLLHLTVNLIHFTLYVSGFKLGNYTKVVLVIRPYTCQDLEWKKKSHAQHKSLELFQELKWDNGLPWRLHAKQGTQVWSLVQEDPTCWAVTKLSCWVAVEPVHCNYWSPCSRAQELQQEKPPQWKAHTPQLESGPCLPELEKALSQQGRPSTAKIKLDRKNEG